MLRAPEWPTACLRQAGEGRVLAEVNVPVTEGVHDVPHMGLVVVLLSRTVQQFCYLLRDFVNRVCGSAPRHLVCN